MQDIPTIFGSFAVRELNQFWSSNPLWSLFHPLVNGRNVGDLSYGVICSSTYGGYFHDA